MGLDPKFPLIEVSVFYLFLPLFSHPTWAFLWFLIASMTKWAMLWNIRHSLVYQKYEVMGFSSLITFPLKWHLYGWLESRLLVLANMEKVTMKNLKMTKIWKIVRSSIVRSGNVHCGKMKISIILRKIYWQLWKSTWVLDY